MQRSLLPLTLLAGLAGCTGDVTTDDATAQPPQAPMTTPDTSASRHVAHGDGVNPRLLRRFKPLRTSFETATSNQRVELGRMLFFDTRLSKDHDLSCNSCHQLDQYGVDHHATSTGSKGQLGRRNSPSVYHAAGAFTNFWDGRAANVEEQAKGPIANPVEMAQSPATLVQSLRGIPGYVAAFKTAFPEDPEITYDRIGEAIGAFERKLVTPSRWDRYLSGDLSALTAKEISGLKVFTDAGCITCHTGELVGDSMFQRVGIAQPWPDQRDRGRKEFTKLDTDDMVFKVPSLRNVAKTAPYFHDGSVETLPEAVRMMGRHQIGEELSDDDIAAIVAWLGCLTGELPAQYIKMPDLPK